MRHLAARWLLSALAVLTVAHEATAQDVPLDMIQRLRVRGVAHPMATDDGRIALHAYVDGDEDARRLGLLPLGPGLAGVRLRPDEIGPFTEARPNVRFGWHPPLRPSLDRSTVWSRVPLYRANTGLDGSNVVVGIIDTGIDVTHPDLRNADGSTRIAWLLDVSRQPTGQHPEVEEAFGCNDESLGGCAVYDASDIDEAIGSTTSVPRDQIGHGTHVASIAAGNGLGSPEGVLTGMAPGATLIAARVTRGGGEDISDFDTLLAARFVFEQAATMGMPAVVNMSLGADFGPHDGTSWLEQGLAAFVGPDQPGRAIVVAAGNSGGLYLADDATYGIHTETRVYPETEVRVPLRAAAWADTTIDGTAYIWMTWRNNESLSVGLEGPDGEIWVSPIPPGETAGVDKKSGGKDVEVVILNDYRGEGSPLPEGTRGAVMLVDGAWSTAGDLTILLEGDGTAELWVQGVGNAGVGAQGLGMMFVRAVKHGTVNMPATHPDLIAVGATLNRAFWNDANGKRVKVDQFGPQSPPIEDSVAYFSGAGPTSTGVPKPEISAPGVFIAAAMSRDANPSVNPTSMFASPQSSCPVGSQQCLVVDAHHAIATGTSMATPAVAGALALLFSLDPTLTSPELVALIQGGARWPEGTVPYPYQMGPGVLDVEGARESYELLGRPMLREPAATKSWVVMASPYARPDPSWPVCGQLETRTSDGGIADGFDAGMLTLEVQGAVVKRALTRMAPGIWKFCVAAPAGSGGGTIHIEARFQNERLGERQDLPIGVDPFVAREGVTALGGCAISRPAATAWRWAALGLLAMLLMRRRSGGR
jgi:subtilisin family serine protease